MSAKLPSELARVRVEKCDLQAYDVAVRLPLSIYLSSA
jgi:hypothetical protein